ncbi:transposase [Candidatus Palauibacter sp.]|uniref:transposase n=1 Tax=Candidatus Palauibacter sp. TaxID=3101350 RepID=UPI003B5921AB
MVEHPTAAATSACVCPFLIRSPISSRSASLSLPYFSRWRIAYLPAVEQPLPRCCVDRLRPPGNSRTTRSTRRWTSFCARAALTSSRRRRAGSSTRRGWAGRAFPPGVYFRMLVVGYLEGIGSERGIAWRCRDSISLREFLGYGLAKTPPEHSTLSKTRKRLSVEAHGAVFGCVWSAIVTHNLVVLARSRLKLKPA